MFLTGDTHWPLAISYDPDHDGEGIILEVLDATTVVVQWFTYDDEGKQFWIQGVGTIDGKTITVKEAFSAMSISPNYGLCLASAVFMIILVITRW